MIYNEKSKYKSFSDLKKRMQDLLCDSLKDRITYFYTNYREVHNVYGRATICDGGKELIAFSWVEAYRQEAQLHARWLEERQAGKPICYPEVLSELQTDSWMPSCTLCERDFVASMTIYLKTDIADSLRSDNYLLRILAYMDRRVGKRTLIRIKDEIEALPDWVKQFYLLRCEAEGLLQINHQESKRPIS